jgi:UDP-2,3-diacylglucosamine hydrolase
MTTFFISDLHLHPSRPEVTECFLRFLKEDAQEAEALYILGDLFEVWLGDDDPDPHYREVIAGLSEFSHVRRPCYIMRGNRDILLGRRFCADASVLLLDESTVISLYDDRVLLLHGDELCTDDHAYQRFRRHARSPSWRALFLSLPLKLRHWLGARLRDGSAAMTATKPEEITDINQDTVEEVMEEHKVKVLVHGHTHRPGIHQFNLHGQAAMRIVLGDWYNQGSVLHWGPGGPELHTLSFT